MLKNRKINIILLILVTCLVLYFSLKDNFMEVVNQIITMNIWYILLALLLLLLFFVFKSISIYLFCKKINKDFKFTVQFLKKHSLTDNFKLIDVSADQQVGDMTMLVLTFID